MSNISLSGYLKRVLICISGLMAIGLGNMFGVLAGSAGTNAWNTLSLGISGRTGISFGTATFTVSVVIILIDLIGRGRLGFGSLLNMVLIPVFSDLFLKLLPFIPAPKSTVMGVICTLAGQTITSFAMVLYMSAALGAGPRDTLMVILGKKVPKMPIGVVRLGIDLLALLAGVLLGAPFGFGTVLVILLQSAIFQLACRVCRFEPRAIEHEDFLRTIRNLRKREPQ